MLPEAPVILSAPETRALALAGYGLAHGVWCAARRRPIGPLLLVDLEGRRNRIPLADGPDAPYRAAAVLGSLGHRTAAAALLTRGRCPPAIVVRAWADEGWAWRLSLPFSGGDRLVLHPETLLTQHEAPERRAVILEALYDGVGLHAMGLQAWVEAEVAV